LATNLSFPLRLQRVVLQKHSESLTFSAHRGSPGSIPVSPCEICSAQSGTGTGLSPSFPLSVSFHQCSILIFIYMLPLPKGQTGEAWEPSEMQKSVGNRRALDRKEPYIFVTRSFTGVHFISVATRHRYGEIRYCKRYHFRCTVSPRTCPRR